MAVERTLSIIKPDATARNITGKIIAKFEDAGLRIIAQKRVHWDETDAAAFYAVHRQRPFYESLCAFMTSGPCMPLVLTRVDAVATLRRVIGATDPAEAERGTVRHLYAESKERNAIHASDSDENADREARFFFSETELLRAR